MTPDPGVDLAQACEELVEPPYLYDPPMAYELTLADGGAIYHLSHAFV